MTTKRPSPLKQIRQHCLSCCGGSTKEVSCCPITDCELWELRFGKGRKAVLSQKGKEFEKYFDKNNLRKGETDVTKHESLCV